MEVQRLIKMNHLSTTDIAEKLKVDRDQLFKQLIDLNLVFYSDKKYHLTEKGEKVGGILINAEKYVFIKWPEDFDPSKLKLTKKKSIGKTIKVKEIGEKLEISSRRVNNILAELGWIEKAVRGWKVTPRGLSIGGVQKNYNGSKYVIWPASILDNIIFKRSTNQLHNASEIENKEIQTPDEILSPNKQIKTRRTYKTKDGHIVKSEGELEIDNILYEANIIHAYERELPILELLKCDFYIPAHGNREAVYIEYWGVEKGYDGPNKLSYEDYEKKKKYKKDIYKRENLRLINVDPVHKENLYRHLMVELLSHDISLE